MVERSGRRFCDTTVILLFFLAQLLRTKTTVSAFEWSAGKNSRPEVNRKAIAGIWKLTPTTQQQLPMKEFTVYPKKPRTVTPSQPEVLLILKEDGSFQQYDSSASTASASFDDEEEESSDSSLADIDTSWKAYQKKHMVEVSRQQHLQQSGNRWFGYIQKGTWAYLDGNLLLAADRPDASTASTLGSSYSSLVDGKNVATSAASKNSILKDTALDGGIEEIKRGYSSTFSDQPKDDTLLKGLVVATYQTRLDDNPVLSAVNSTSTSTDSRNENTILESSNGQSTIQFDTHLSVPRGSVNMGKFFYPKHHPSFFEQPMFQPAKTGTFALQQILGNLNTAHHDTTNDLVKEKYRRADFYNKTFLLTSQPLQNPQRSSGKGEKRWSIKYNDYVYDPPKNKKNTNSDVPTSAVRVLQVAFYSNNTFSTTGGLGGAAILRGKFDIIGTDNDHLWMQVIRFGFGRSVSGSVYSEGPMLSHEDIKAYWGTIRKLPPVLDKKINSTIASNVTTVNILGTSVVTEQASIEDESASFRIEVEGSVLDGLGLEPIPVARFILREIHHISEEDLCDDDDDEEDIDEEIRLSEGQTLVDFGLGDDGIDWTSARTDESFQ
jgi:hypothetical protein